MIQPDGNIIWTVEPQYTGQRLDRYLARRLGHRSRASLRQMIRDGGLTIHRVAPGYQRPPKAKPSTLVHGGMQLLLFVKRDKKAKAPLKQAREPLSILFEDDHIIVVNKPAGMLVHPAGLNYHNTLIIELKKQGDDAIPLHLGHRLDRETSGVLVVAKGDENNCVIKANFQARRIKKGYLAIVRGNPPWETESNTLAMGKAENHLVRIRQALRPDGNSAKTEFTVLERFDDHALVACRPHTGRLHQIRLHLEGLGYPILGDKIYGTDGTPFDRFLSEGLSPELEAQLGHWRHALHAHWLEFEHPHTGEWVRHTAPLSSDLEEILQRLRTAS